MRKLVLLLIALVFAASWPAMARAGDNSPVRYTVTVTSLGEGAHGGGPLYADGSVGGDIGFAVYQGQVILQLYATSWSEVVPGTAIDVCFDVSPIKGEPIFPPSFCASDMGALLPVSGTPVIIPNPVAPGYLLIRVTPAN